MPQIGALIQLLRTDSTVAAAVRTDNHGSFALDHVLPGIYGLRVTDSSFLPTLRQGFKVVANRRTTENLTLSTVFDLPEWLPAKVRTAAEPVDDWEWTLRSSTNRPLLRLADAAPPPGGEAPRAPHGVIRLRSEGRSGSFGASGWINSFQSVVDHGDEGQMLVRADLGAAAGGPGAYFAGFERPLGPGRVARGAIRFVSEPQVGSQAKRGGLREFAMNVAEADDLTPDLHLEAGEELAALAFGGEQVAMRPFGSVSWHSGANSVRYSVATARDAQTASTIGADAQWLAGIAADPEGTLTVERGLHQEIRFGHKTGAGWSTALGLVHDRTEDAAIAGGVQARNAAGGVLAGPFLIDQSSGTLRYAGPRFGGNGVLLSAEGPLGPEITVSATFMASPALAAAANLQSPSSPRLQSRTAGAVLLTAKGTLSRAGTHWRASYRAQSPRTVTLVAPYDSALDAAYLSFLLRQPLHFGRVRSGGVEAVIDASNLLAEGYCQFRTADGTTWFLAQETRTVAGGLAFKF